MTRRRVVVQGRVQGVGFCHDGPRGASVERVQASDEEPEGLHAFEVR